MFECKFSWFKTDFKHSIFDTINANENEFKNRKRNDSKRRRRSQAEYEKKTVKNSLETASTEKKYTKCRMNDEKC